MRHLTLVWLACLGLCAMSEGGKAQQPADAGVQGGPRFLYAPNSSDVPVRLDVKRTPVLARRVYLDLRGATLEEALDQLSRQAGLKLSYSKALVPLNQRVRLVAEEITVAGALSDLLFDVDVDVLFTMAGQAVLVPRSQNVDAIPLVGIVTGRVTDSLTSEGIAGAAGGGDV